MVLKIVAGVVAALAVVGIGVYMAMPTSITGTCGNKCPAPAPQAECCFDSAVCPAEVVESAATPSCCSAASAKTVDADAIAACGGGLTAIPATKTRAKVACCSE